MATDPNCNPKPSPSYFVQDIRTPRNDTSRLLTAQQLKQAVDIKKIQFEKKCKDRLSQVLRRALCRCPICLPINITKDKVAGKNYFKIPFTNIKIPRWDYILLGVYVTFDAIRRRKEKCGACGGRKRLVDYNDDAAAYERIAKTIDEKSEHIMAAESRLGMGGTRTTLIQGSETLFVGIGFNNAQTYEVIKDGSYAPSLKGGKIPQMNAVKVNAVVGKQGSLGWPQQVGNYTIKCANKFTLLAGSGGATLATTGPMTISAGMLNIVAPQVAVGSSTGPLTLEGNSVNITGKAISITPTGGELFVKGNISNTGNVTTQGHAHFESVSFIKAAGVLTTKPTMQSIANPDVTLTQPATWSLQALASALLDLQTYFSHILTDSNTSAFRLFSPKEIENIGDRLLSISKLGMPWELLPTGYIMPGLCITSGVGNLGAPVISSNIGPVPIHNFPHAHGIPELQHLHEVSMPDIQTFSGTPKALRSKMLNGAHESGMPADPTKDVKARLDDLINISVEFYHNVIVSRVKLLAKKVRLMFR
jgi:hypothetical protein